MRYLDTSVVAAYYIPEKKSAKVEKFLSGLDTAAISSLTEVEFHSAVARRVRMRSDNQNIVFTLTLHKKVGKKITKP